MRTLKKLPVLFLISVCAVAQNFEVAALKSHPKGVLPGDYMVRPGQSRVVLEAYTLRGLVRLAYDTSDEYLNGSPPWANSITYDLTAKSEKPYSMGQFRTMLRSLLVERFKLKVEETSKEMPAFRLKLDPDLPLKITPVPNDSMISFQAITVDANNRGVGNVGDATFLKVTARGMSVTEFAKYFEGLVRQPVIEETGQVGTYDFVFSCPLSPTIIRTVSCQCN